MRVLLLAALAVLLASGPATAQSDDAAGVELATAEAGESKDLFARDSFKTTPIVCPFKGKVDYKPGEVSCGLLSVPENRERPRSRKIQLHYVKLAARKPDKWDADKRGDWKKRADPIIYLTGGPGATATGYVKRLQDHGARDVRDLYILEQRGIGYSGDYCPLYSSIDPAAANAADWESQQRVRLGLMEACFAGAKARGVDLSGYSSIENARDVQALRQALGIGQWNVWGISYGSILGQAYLKQDPEGIRAAVIDAIVPLKQGENFQRIGEFLQRDLTILEKACAKNETCAAHFPDIDGRLKGAIKAVMKQPFELDAIDAELYPSGKATIFHDIVGGLPFIMLYEQKNYATIPAFIDAFAKIVDERDFAAFRILTAGGGFEGTEISQGMYDAIACNDGWYTNLRATIEKDQAAHPILGSIFGDPAIFDEASRLCRKYGMTPRAAEEYAPVETDIRTLIVNGQMDPITPPTLAKLIVPGFANGTYVEFPFAGHGPTRSVKCGGDFLTKFFDEPDGELDISCVKEMKAPDFAGPLYETRGLLRLGALAAEDPKKAALPALWFGLPAVILIIGALVYSLAPIARLINPTEALTTAGARPLAWATAILGAASIAGLGAGAALSFKANELLLLVGMLGWARWFAWAGLAGGVLGLVVLFLAGKARAAERLPIGVLVGLVLTGLAGVALAAFLLVWGFAPF